MSVVSWWGLGIVCVAWLVVSIVLITLESGSLVVRRKMLPLRRTIKPVACEPNEANDGFLVHVDCPIRRMQNFHLPSPFHANLPSGFTGVFLEMKVEMFQDAFRGDFFTSRIHGSWSDHIVMPSSTTSNKVSIDPNPDYFPHVEGSGRQFSQKLYGGFFELDRSMIVNFHSKRKIKLIDDKVYKPSDERPPTKVSSENTQVFDHSLYTGDPLHPKIGDLRVSFFGSAATHLSAIGIQQNTTASHTLASAVDDYANWILHHPLTRRLTPFQDPVSPVNGTVLLLREGDHKPADLINGFEYQRDFCARYLWSGRLMFAILTFLLAWGSTRAYRMESIEQRPSWISVITSLLVALGAVSAYAGLFNLPVLPGRGAIQILTCLILWGLAFLTDLQGKPAAPPAPSKRQRSSKKTPPTTGGYTPVLTNSPTPPPAPPRTNSSMFTTSAQLPMYAAL